MTTVEGLQRNGLRKAGLRGLTVGHGDSSGFLSKFPGYIDQAIDYHANGMAWQREHSTGMRVDPHIDSTTTMMRRQQLNVVCGNYKSACLFNRQVASQ